MIGTTDGLILLTLAAFPAIVGIFLLEGKINNLKKEIDALHNTNRNIGKDIRESFAELANGIISRVDDKLKSFSVGNNDR